MARFRELSLSTAIMLSMSTAALAQIQGTETDIGRFAPVDASALGVTRGANIGVFTGNNQLYVGGGVGLAGGSLRGVVGGDVGTDLGNRWSFGAGFARTFATRPLGSSLHATAGVEVQGGYEFNRPSPRGAAASSLTIPLALTVGDANRPAEAGPALAIYAAPYAEAGVANRLESFTCPGFGCGAQYRIKNEDAVGIGVGARLSFGRFAMELMDRDVFGKNFEVTSGGALALGFSYRLGQ